MKLKHLFLGFAVVVSLSACQVNAPVLPDSQSDEVVFKVGPEQKDCVGVAPMKCLVVDGKFFYDRIKGFDFEPGFDYELKVKKSLAFGTDDPEKIPADASLYSYELIEVMSKTPATESSAIPDNCESWFDGCNNCTVQDGKMAACTRKFCPEDAMQEPKCLQFSS